MGYHDAAAFRGRQVNAVGVDAAPQDGSLKHPKTHQFAMAEFLSRIHEFLQRFQYERPIITSDTVTFGILMAVLGIAFWASNRKALPRCYWPVLGMALLLGGVLPWLWQPPESSQDGTTASILWFYLLPTACFAAFLAFVPMYRVIPMLLICYFGPSLMTAFGWIDPVQSNIYKVATQYLLPACLVLLTLSIDFREILKLGPKALIMFLTGTVGVIVGGPLALLIVGSISPDTVRGQSKTETWRGMSTVAGSWIGGGANQTAMKEIFLPDEIENAPADYAERARDLFSVMAAVDVLVAEFWMIFLLLGVGKSEAMDRFFKADASSIERLRAKMEAFSNETARIPTTGELIGLLAIVFFATSISHVVGDWLANWVASHAPSLRKFSLDSSFFWLIILTTSIGLTLSFTPARRLEGIGASKIGTVFIFILVATIGLKMNVLAVFEYPGLFLVGLLWMAIHVGLLFVVGYFIRAPFFFLAVGSKANIGGAASAPVVAAAFHPALAPVGVLLAVLGYALGTYGAWLCAIMMQQVAPSVPG